MNEVAMIPIYLCSSPYDRQWYELNVASGQSLIGSIIGFSLVVAGKDSIIWLSPDPKSIPPYKVSDVTKPKVYSALQSEWQRGSAAIF